MRLGGEIHDISKTGFVVGRWYMYAILKHRRDGSEPLSMTRSTTFLIVVLVRRILYQGQQRKL